MTVVVSVQSGQKKKTKEFYMEKSLETLDIIRNERRYFYKGKKFDLSEQIDNSIEDTILYRPNATFDHRIPQPPDPKLKSQIQVSYETTFHAAIRLVQEEHFPEDEVAVLNFASPRQPGGGFKTGSNAQEESLARQSTLYASIGQERVFEMYKNSMIDDNCLNSDYMIFSPNIVIFRDDDDEFLPWPVNTSIITCAAANLTHWPESNGMEEVHRVMLQRCRKIIQIAILNDITVLVLGAFGCGVFHNNPVDVANYFKTVLIDENYRQYFDLVVFAIHGNHNRAFDIFKDAFN